MRPVVRLTVLPFLVTAFRFLPDGRVTAFAIKGSFLPSLSAPSRIAVTCTRLDEARFLVAIL